MPAPATISGVFLSSRRFVEIGAVSDEQFHGFDISESAQPAGMARVAMGNNSSILYGAGRIP